MLSLSLALFGLIRSKHLYNLLKFALYYFFDFNTGTDLVRFAAYKSPHFRFYTMTNYIIYENGCICQEIFYFFT